MLPTRLDEIKNFQIVLQAGGIVQSLLELAHGIGSKRELVVRSSGGGRLHRIGLGGMCSAYLWLAAESDAHPLDPELSLTLALLFAMGPQ